MPVPTDPLSATKALFSIGRGILTLGRGVNWVTKLADKWGRLKQERRRELARAAEDFGNLEALAEVYVEPDCQPQNPADEDEDDPVFDFRKPVGTAFGKFLKDIHREHDGSHIMFVLSDAGMGKSSLLMMLKLSHEMKFWPSGVRFDLLKIGADTTDRLAEMEDKTNTVLLLDALDEDRIVWGSIQKSQERIEELLRATKVFRQVILTCRTQFFPKGVEDERFGRVEIGGFRCNLLYISPFSETQVRAYLNKSIRWTWKERLWHFVGKDSPRMGQALEIVSLMRSLRMRPMLLAHIEDLMGAKVERWDVYSVYDVLVDRWLGREVLKGHTPYSKGELRQACKQVAVLLYGQGRRSIPEAELDAYQLGEAKAAPIKSIEVKGRSLLNRTSDGDYRFAHYSVQEFFVAESLIEGKVTETVDATDMVQALIFDWVQAKPVERVCMVRWTLLGTRSGDYLPSRLNLASTNLANAHLPGAKLLGADLTHATLERSTLSDANLSGADLSGANLSGADLNGADLNGADLRGADLNGADLRGADLSGAGLSGADLSGADLRGVDLSDADLRDVVLRQIAVSRGNLATKLPDTLERPHSWILLAGAKEWKKWRKKHPHVRPYLYRAALANADLRGTDLSGANLRGANLRGARLNDANLNDADLIGADLNSADLTDTDLGCADLSRAILCGANLSRAELRRAILNHANLYRANLCGAEISRAYLTGTNLSGVNLSNSDLSYTDLRNAKGLTQAAIGSAQGNQATELPAHVPRPDHWDVEKS